eukprot:1157587-Pelagomonas_calceolata.AAC.8
MHAPWMCGPTENLSEGTKSLRNVFGSRASFISSLCTLIAQPFPSPSLMFPFCAPLTVERQCSVATLIMQLLCNIKKVPALAQRPSPKPTDLILVVSRLPYGCHAAAWWLRLKLAPSATAQVA